MEHLEKELNQETNDLKGGLTLIGISLLGLLILGGAVISFITFIQSL